MSFLKNIIRNAVSDGVSKGIRDAVSSAAEKIVAPKAEEYANSLAGSLDEAAQAINSASSGAAEAQDAVKTSEGMSSLEQALGKLTQAAEKYAKAAEAAAGANAEKISGLTAMGEKLQGFPMWHYGGTDFSLDERSTSENGTVYYDFIVNGTTCEAMCEYIKDLKAAGFVQRYKGSDEVLYKDLGGEYLVFSCVEAFEDENSMDVCVYRTKYESEI